MPAQVAAAYIAASVASVTLVATIIFNWLTRRADIQVRRREAAEEQRRSVYASFVSVIEPVVDTLKRSINLGPKTLELMTSEETASLLAQSIESRGKRVMVEIVGPSEVGAPAQAFERALDRTVRAFVAGDAELATSEFITMAGERSIFIAHARDALDPMDPTT